VGDYVCLYNVHKYRTFCKSFDAETFSIHITTLYLLANFVIILLTMVIVVMIIKCYLYKYEEIKEVCKPS